MATAGLLYAGYRYLRSKATDWTYYDGKVVWVTGASSGIGKELCLQLVKRSEVKLVLSSRSEATLNGVKAELVEAGAKDGNIAVVPLDLGELETLVEAVEKVFDCFGHIDLLINNAGISQRSLARMTSFDVYRRLIKIDFEGQVLLTQTYIKKLVESGRSAHITFISSVAGRIPVPFRSGYCAAKAALNSYAATIRIELELEGHPIAVTVVSPGGVKTAVSKNALNKDGKPFGEADAVTAEGMNVAECCSQMICAISNKVDDFIVCSSLERFACTLFTHLPLKLATRVILPKYKRYLSETLARVK
ncbi:short chain dehydrogenase [Chloropicon primus]|uniref:Short chain dehydrogenase n=1 Tax=Chloropicon primus TaxID=1764295 RepID=A0A5B8MIB4_9CHLO|nr:short chain dehydrogenase [Chloropicon primus]UPQ99587.1 short chain dehydrogenase [Chloropicon primus]|eukprot:QDZ20378.1 short chain dehydrogenase [Chloropicon primus]